MRNVSFNLDRPHNKDKKNKKTLNSQKLIKLDI